MKLEDFSDRCIWYIIFGQGVKCRAKCKFKIGEYCGCYWVYEGDRELRGSNRAILACGWSDKMRNK